MPLTDLRCRRAKPASKPYKLADAHSLSLHVLPTGSKSWRWKYRYSGKERQLGLGAYPEVGLAEARERQDEARKALRGGRDPRAARRIETLVARPGGSTFKSVALEWHKRNSPKWSCADYAADIMSQLENWVFPRLGHTDIRTIRLPEMLAVLRRIEDAGFLSTARRVCKTCSAVFVFAIASDATEIDPAAMVRPALTAARVTPRRAVTTLPEVRALLRAVEKLDTQPIFKLPLRFLAITAARSAMVLGATWDEIETAGNIPTWRVPKQRMKMRDEYVSPLPGSALDILRAMAPLREGDLIFPD
jgi:integrase